MIEDNKFIYVFDENSMRKLKEAGFHLIIDNKKESIFVFESSNNINFSLYDIDYVTSNTLTF